MVKKDKTPNQTVNSSGRLKAGKILTFILNGEEYGFEILKIKEIIRMMSITSVPRTPDFFKGVINLRGRIIPVIDLRMRFGIDEAEYSKETCIITVQIRTADNVLVVGVIVDSVSDVVDIEDDQLEPPLAFGMGIRNEFILGMGKLEEAVVIILDAEKILDLEYLSLAEETIGQALTEQKKTDNE